MTGAPRSFATARLRAEPLSEDDLAELTALHLDPEVSRYLGGVRTPEVTQAYLTVNLEHWARHGFGLWTLRTPYGAYAGRAGLRHLEVGGIPEVEIAYTLPRTLWGQGLVGEITAALTRIGFEDLKLPSLVGVVMVGNTASRHVLEKTGYALESETVLHGEPCVVYRRRPVSA